jgi:hypothetical protein
MLPADEASRVHPETLAVPLGVALSQMAIGHYVSRALYLAAKLRLAARHMLEMYRRRYTDKHLNKKLKRFICRLDRVAQNSRSLTAPQNENKLAGQVTVIANSRT